MCPSGRGNRLTRHILAPVLEGNYSTVGYYDKRRVENNLRRLVEHVEEWWSAREENEVDFGTLYDKFIWVGLVASGVSTE
ncbi:hypothetical protein Pmar_PMAR008039 [Perkinsus marinus ATCC 50983]|uniref:Uncharacterized protein n=1 Tax=Perkinsus marinus (strain ATCC 50983 / TXsc) TaxID=423536 RepID=C5LFL2_PERM5|nr:hypothetical protein Pmar_PMAR008039 [Perkinsus marinus ATCC 50983]EER04486.1 hypothetical protein Pmar_PMAR008039 [Perkinsus marinus ATCC 50983]|eukprot:XP_002772670.1 hypothetical protein Pmar_PMAR008039 [Perkinsus marinus ATCC 50983]